MIRWTSNKTAEFNLDKAIYAINNWKKGDYPYSNSTIS